ncbi:MAG TPA: hypothetical protein VKC60_01360 [Opitutaceae bacterium]|nr:hypothetical protein [Opitutaceae bacterium]
MKLSAKSNQASWLNDGVLRDAPVFKNWERKPLACRLENAGKRPALPWTWYRLPAANRL